MLIFVGLLLGGYKLKLSDPKSSAPVRSGFYKVVSIADGDTITVDMEGRKEKVRFIGVDTPEINHEDLNKSECYALKSKEYTESLIDGREVELVTDKYGSTRDKYGRLLRYVNAHDGRSIDELLVGGGYGFAVDGFEYSKKKDYLNLMSHAEDAKQGVWGFCQIDRSKGYPEVAN